MTGMVYIIGCAVLIIMRGTTNVPDGVYVAQFIILTVNYLFENFWKGNNK